MALTAVITKQSVVKLIGSNDYKATIHIVITDESSVVIFEEDYSEQYYSQLELDTIEAKFQAKFVTGWDGYIAEQNILNAVQFDTMVSGLQAAANTYINQ